MARNAPFRSLRAWLRHLRETDRLAAMREAVPLEHELAAVAKSLDGSRATWFPRPGGMDMPVVSGVISDRSWMAEAIGVPVEQLAETFAAASAAPVPWAETEAGWHDARRREFEASRLKPLETEVRSALEAMAQLSDLLDRARKECE